MARSEACILRDRLRESEGMRGWLAGLVTALMAQAYRLMSENAALRADVRRLSGRSRMYEGPNAPPSASPIGRGRRRRAKGGGAGPPAALTVGCA